MAVGVGEVVHSLTNHGGAHAKWRRCIAVLIISSWGAARGDISVSDQAGTSGIAKYQGAPIVCNLFGTRSVANTTLA